MSSVSLIFPHQLFKDHPSLHKSRSIFIIEDPLFFRQFAFHKQKLVFHRASMKQYAEDLTHQGFEVTYIDSQELLSATEKLFDHLKRSRIQSIYLCDPVDYLLDRRIRRYATRNKIQLHIEESPNFLSSNKSNVAFFSERKRYFMNDYYIHQRKELQILISDNKPEGGKWTYDTENRNKIPKGTAIPEYRIPNVNGYTKEAIDYVEKNFSKNPGNSFPFYYPISHDSALQQLDNFLRERFNKYGTYQDAIVPSETFLFHSIISPLLNIGLLDPTAIVDRTIEFANKNNIPLNSLEGFIRQIIGWREFIRAVYNDNGTFQRKNNFLNHHRKLPASFYNGTTGITPVDDAIKKALATGYVHHIERLMVLGNFMLLCEVDPNDIYQWFMEMFIDSYDWVMVPNVYGMSQYADGGLMSTKPYISGSNYILKMSNYKKDDWCEIWDALYWNFIIKHRELFSKNPRMSMMVMQVNKMSEEKIHNIKSTSEKFLSKLK
jgi:deoxyribodipyrimidine photolyase-related protein